MPCRSSPVFVWNGRIIDSVRFWDDMKWAQDLEVEQAPCAVQYAAVLHVIPQHFAHAAELFVRQDVTLAANARVRYLRLSKVEHHKGKDGRAECMPCNLPGPSHLN